MKAIRWLGLSLWDVVVSPVVVGGFFVLNEAMSWSRVRIDDACGTAVGLWKLLMYLRTALSILEWLVICAVYLQTRHATRLGSVPLLIVGVSVKAILTGMVLQWAVGWTLGDADLNTRYCEWRAEKACWQTPNTTLETYEQLFPVTHATLFQRELSQPFRPLETRYEVAVMWNAMMRCREYSFQDAADSQHLGARLFSSLPPATAVDAWCGAMHLSRGQEGTLLVSHDAVTSPAEAYGDAVTTTCGSIREKIISRVMMHWWMMVVFALNCNFGSNAQGPQTTRPTTERVDTSSLETQPTVTEDKPLDVEQQQEAKRCHETADPSWVDVPSE